MIRATTPNPQQDSVPDGALVSPCAGRTNAYLEKLAQGNAAAIIVVCGPSGGGKSTLVGFLEAEGAASGIRLLPRLKREGDTKGDTSWLAQIATDGDHIRDLQGPEDMAFAQICYQGAYGFPAREFVQLFKGATLSESNGAFRSEQVHILGRVFEVPAFIEAVRNLLPLVPIVVVRPDVPLAVVEERLKSRYHGQNTPERDERLTRQAAMIAADAMQIELVANSYGLISVQNRAPGDRPEQWKAAPTDSVPSVLTQELFCGHIATALGSARLEAQTRAQDLLKVRELTSPHRYIPVGLIDVLREKLLPAVSAHIGPIAVKGGLAVALLLRESRPVSLDIDFVLPEPSVAADTHRQDLALAFLLENLGIVDPQIKDAWQKNTYHVRGASTAIQSDLTGEMVELDGITATRLQAKNRGFCFEMPCDGHDLFHARRVVVPSSHGTHTLLVVPPEHLILEKLLAGRGPELHKFDLFDVAGLLSHYEPDLSLVRKLIARQRYFPEIDWQVASAIREANRLDAAIDLPSVTQSPIRQLLEAQHGHVVRTRLPGIEKRIFDLGTIKQIMFCDRAIESLDRVVAMAETDHPWVVGSETVTIQEHFGAEKLSERANRLKALLLSYALFEAGRAELYVRRPQRDREAERVFFQGLPAQQHRVMHGATRLV